jgi:hypothetical protein
VTLEQGDLVWVTAPWATFGLIVRDGLVVEAAPICRWAVGEKEWKVADYLRQRGAQFRRVP